MQQILARAQFPLFPSIPAAATATSPLMSPVQAINSLNDFARLLRQSQQSHSSPAIPELGSDNDNDLPTRRPRSLARPRPPTLEFEDEELTPSGHFRSVSTGNRQGRVSNVIIQNDTGVWEQLNHPSCQRLPAPSFWRMERTSSLVIAWIALPGILPEQVFLIWPSEEEDRLTPTVIIKPSRAATNPAPNPATEEPIKIPLGDITYSMSLEHVGKMPSEYTFVNGLLRMAWPRGNDTNIPNEPRALFQQQAPAPAPVSNPLVTSPTAPAPATLPDAWPETSSPPESPPRLIGDSDEEDHSFDSADACDRCEERKIDEQCNFRRYYDN
jgi:hypothetical protein